MKAHSIEMYVPVRLAPEVARDAVIRVLRDIGAGAEAYNELSLGVNLRGLGMPSHADVRVPVDARVEPRPARWECGLELRAKTEDRFFPTFRGTAIVSAGTTPGETELWLQGGYVPPMGMVGAGLDATVLRGAAERSLRTFLEWLGKEIKRVAEVNERELRDRVQQRGSP